ncbi:protein translocase subunit SecF [Caproiciproducens faecalis]|uniref:Protein-export membrane protein SecF n=1 Tax=Caproiciproducens faecalis TaxID=2820301 RepID=A0ABS7DQU5_9FIRM|nr:protein translocase subunit SecF [Caproiciproducens faecalis]MBW7573669.1 protein translocase subunit SecF [Caproiciproducens faecalis]
MRIFNIKFFENRKIFFGISLGIMAIGLIFNIIFGTQLDIQFTGGAVIKYSYSGSIKQEDVEKIVQDTAKKDVTVRILENVKSADGAEVKNNVSISFAGTDSITIDNQQAIAKALAAKYPDAGFQVVESSSVNPSMGRSFFAKCIAAVAIASLLLILYVALRFKKIGGMSAGIMAIIALLHDVLMVYFTFIIFRMPLNDSFIAVVLTILGYSLNDTIIIYDRIRENRRLLGPKTPYSVLVNTSINQTFTRSLYTAGCTFSSIATVYVVGAVFGLTSVTTFALPMMVGVVTGCYSSVCIAGPMYVMWQNHKATKRAEAKA